MLSYCAQTAAVLLGRTFVGRKKYRIEVNFKCCTASFVLNVKQVNLRKRHRVLSCSYCNCSEKIKTDYENAK